MYNIVGYVHVGTCRISPDHNFLAYTLDCTGSEQFMLQIKDLRSGSIIPKKVSDVVSLAWAQDGNTLFYTQTDENQRPCRQNLLSLAFFILFLYLLLPFFFKEMVSPYFSFTSFSGFYVRIWTLTVWMVSLCLQNVIPVFVWT